MKISRRGSRAHHGVSSIDFASPCFAWNDTEGVLDVRQSHVTDFTTASTHDYTVSIAITEILAMLQILSEAVGKAENGLLASSLRPATADAIRLALAGIGVLKAEEPGGNPAERVSD
ncbi:MAG: hypothetical protein JXA57_18610 [Armatimonadetes bacterium]|nr:hypothetical protein [Armatimonadota bacterium]